MGARSVQAGTFKLSTRTHWGERAWKLLNVKLSRASSGFRDGHHTHDITGVHIPARGEVSIDHQQVVLVTRLPEVLLIYVIRLQNNHVTDHMSAEMHCAVAVCRALPQCERQGAQQSSWQQISALVCSAAGWGDSGDPKESPGATDLLYRSEREQSEPLLPTIASSSQYNCTSNTVVLLYQGQEKDTTVYRLVCYWLKKPRVKPKLNNAKVFSPWGWSDGWSWPVRRSVCPVSLGKWMTRSFHSLSADGTHEPCICEGFYPLQRQRHPTRLCPATWKSADWTFCPLSLTVSTLNWLAGGETDIYDS